MQRFHRRVGGSGEPAAGRERIVDVAQHAADAAPRGKREFSERPHWRAPGGERREAGGRRRNSLAFALFALHPSSVASAFHSAFIILHSSLVFPHPSLLTPHGS